MTNYYLGDYEEEIDSIGNIRKIHYLGSRLYYDWTTIFYSLRNQDNRYITNDGAMNLLNGYIERNSISNSIYNTYFTIKLYSGDGFLIGALIPGIMGKGPDLKNFPTYSGNGAMGESAVEIRH